MYNDVTAIMKWVIPKRVLIVCMWLWERVALSVSSDLNVHLTQKWKAIMQFNVNAESWADWYTDTQTERWDVQQGYFCWKDWP